MNLNSAVNIDEMLTAELRVKGGLKRIINGLEDKALGVFGSLRELNLNGR